MMVVMEAKASIPEASYLKNNINFSFIFLKMLNLPLLNLNKYSKNLTSYNTNDQL